MPPIHDAQSDDDEPQSPFPQMPPLVIGDPFAIAEGVELLERVSLDENTVRRAAQQGLPGCVATVKCDGPEGRPCGAKFRIDLLKPGVKNCPKCKTKYTSVLLIAPVDDDDILADAMSQVLRSNGYQLPEGAGGGELGGDDEEEEEGDAEGDEAEGDDDQGDDDDEDDDRARAREHFQRDDE